MSSYEQLFNQEQHFFLYRIVKSQPVEDNIFISDFKFITCNQVKMIIKRKSMARFQRDFIFEGLQNI